MSNQTSSCERYFIYFTNLLSSISFSMFFSSLTLYLNEYLHFSFSNSSLISGVYFSVHFMMPLLGSFLINRYFAPRVLILFSSFCIAFGSLLICLNRPSLLYLGLSFAMFGSGFSSVSTNCYINQRLHLYHEERDKLFHYSYSFINAGFLLGFAIGGYFEVHHLHYYLYLVSLVISSIRLLLVLFFWRQLKIIDAEKPFKLVNFILLPIMPFIGLISYHFVDNTPSVLFTAAMIAIISMWSSMIKNSTTQERHKILTFSVFYTGSLIYWMIYYTGPMGVTLFIKQNVDRMVHGIEIAPQWLFNINALLTMSLAPIIVHFRQRPPLNKINNLTAKQFSLALLLLALSFACFSIGIYFANSDGYSPLSYSILHFITQSLSEVLLAPIGVSLVARFIPRHYQNTMMGFWMMIGGIATTCSSRFSSLMNAGNQSNPLFTNLNYLSVFNKFTLLASITSLLLYCLFYGIRQRHVKSSPMAHTL